MPINFHPKCGAILVFDFHGFIEPEMVKRRPVVVISPQMSDRPGLCTIVPFSTTEPYPIKPYHHKLIMEPLLPSPYDSPFQWVKGDMIYTVSYERLNFMFNGKDASGKRIYDKRVVSPDVLKIIRACVLNGLGIKVDI